MFGLISRKKTLRLVKAYEKLLRTNGDLFPQTFLALCAQIGDLRRELGLYDPKDNKK